MTFPNAPDHPPPPPPAPFDTFWQVPYDLRAFKRNALRADVSKYQPEVYNSEKSKILKKIHKVALGKLLT